MAVMSVPWLPSLLILSSPFILLFPQLPEETFQNWAEIMLQGPPVALSCLSYWSKLLCLATNILFNVLLPNLVLLIACCFPLLIHMHTCTHTPTHMCAHTLTPPLKQGCFLHSSLYPACLLPPSHFHSFLNCVKCVFSPCINILLCSHSQCNFPWYCLWIFLLLIALTQSNCVYILCHAV